VNKLILCEYSSPRF